MQKTTQKRKNKTFIVITLVVLVIALLLGTAALAYTQKWWPFNEPESLIIDGINYGPPTDEEVENSQDAKKDILEEDAANSSGDDNDLKKVIIGVSHSEVYDGNVEVRAFISGVVEGAGTCTATLTQPGAQTVTKSNEAFIDASTSQCRPILIPLNQFDQKGEWVLVVTYKSPTSYGTSEKVTVNI